MPRPFVWIVTELDQLLVDEAFCLAWFSGSGCFETILTVLDGFESKPTFWIECQTFMINVHILVRG